MGRCCITEGAEDGVGWEGGLRGRGDIYIYIFVADLHCHTAEINTTL